jgi:hypothetical protein
MRANLNKKEWEDWKDAALKEVMVILHRLDIMIDDDQPHLSGERYLMSGKKLVLQGLHKTTNKKIVIKYASDKEYVKEIKNERQKKESVANINFGYKSLSFPIEFLFESNKNYTILVTEFITQDILFIKLPLQTQFFLSLKVLEAFEGIHTVVSKHNAALKKLGGNKNYVKIFNEMVGEIRSILPDNKELLEKLKIAEKYFNS